MNAIVLVGGEGTRLRPLTWRTPKALVPVLGRPLLEHLILHLKQHGVTHVTLAMTRRSPAIREAFGDGSALGLSIDYAYEDTPLGSGGAIAGIAQGWTDTFIVVNGDVITNLDISAMLANHRAKQAVLSLSLHEVEDPSPFGVVDIDADGRIHRFVEKPPREEAPSHLINAGTWIFEPRLADMLDASTFNRVEDGLFPDLCTAGEPVYGFHQHTYWADVGNPDALLQVNLDMARGLVTSPATPAVEDGRHVHHSSTIADKARIEAPAVIGSDCRIEAGATLRGSLIWDNVHIEEGATIIDSTLATGVHVGAGAHVNGAVVAHHAQVPAHTTVDHISIEPADEPLTQMQTGSR